MPQLDRIIFSVELNSFCFVFIVFFFFFPKFLYRIKNLLMIRLFKYHISKVFFLDLVPLSKNFKIEFLYIVSYFMYLFTTLIMYSYILKIELKNLKPCNIIINIK